MSHLVQSHRKQCFGSQSSLIEERFFSSFQYATVGFSKVGLNCEWLWVNEKLCEMTGYSEAELLKLTFCDITHPEDLQTDLCNMEAVMAGQLPINVMEKRYICKDGSIVWVHLTATLIRDDQGEPDYFIALIEDITPRKLAEKALLQSNRDLENFSLVVSHHLLNPVRKMKAFTEFVSKDSVNAFSEDSIDYLSRMQLILDRMQFMVEDLLDFSRVIKKQVPFERIDLGKVMLRAVEALTQARRDVNGRIELEKIPDVFIWGNAAQVQQAFQNIIENALKFHQDNVPPCVKISTRYREGLCDIVIEDNGIGFPEAQAESIFEMFKRLSLHGKYPDTGIGLPLARKVIEQHHGTIKAHSAPDHGATFIISLPTRLPDLASSEVIEV